MRSGHRGCSKKGINGYFLLYCDVHQGEPDYLKEKMYGGD